MAASNFESKMREKRAKEAKIEFLQKEHKRDQLCLFTNHWQLHAGDARRRIDESIIADEKRVDEENYRNAARERRTKANRDQDQKIASAMQMRKARELSEATWARSARSATSVRYKVPSSPAPCAGVWTCV